VEIRDSARKRGIADADLIHAIRYAVAILDLDDDIRMYLGPDRSGQLLEVGVADPDTDEARVIHGMALRRNYRRFLSEG